MCGDNLGREHFTAYNWRLGDDSRQCNKKECNKKTRNKWKCIKCQRSQDKDMFSNWLKGRSAKNQKNNGKAWCNDCKSEAQKEEEKLAVSNLQHIQKSR